ncbi:MAG: glycosyltransferase family 4 protein [Steroidobacteraceae bacterium]
MPGPRICWLTEEFPPETGGTGMVAARIARALAPHVPVCVVTRQLRPARPARDRFGQARVRRIRPAGVLKGAGWRALPALAFYLARLTFLLTSEARRYDIIVVSSMKIMPLVAVPICRLLRKRCIVRLESPFELVQPIAAESLSSMGSLVSRPLSRLLGVMQRYVLARADCVIAISHDIEARLREVSCPPERILRLPNPIDLERFRPIGEDERRAMRERLGLPLARTLVLYVGRLSRAKGVLLLIEAWRELIDRHPNLYLVFAGSGKGSWDSCEDELKQQARAGGLDASVRFVGETDRVEHYMQAADLYVLPSEYEGFSLSIGEALGCALPAVVTSVGAAPELIRDGVNGYLFAPKDRRALIEAVSTALEQRDRWPQLRRLARETAERFGLQQIVCQYLALFRTLARARGAVRDLQTARRGPGEPW